MSTLSRRCLLAGAVAAPLAWRLPSASARPGGHGPIAGWIRRTAIPLRHGAPHLTWETGHALRRMVGRARIVGLGEASHTTDSLFRLKQEVTHLLATTSGFNTVAWEEAWGSGVLVDRYITDGIGNPWEIAGQATYHLQSPAFVDFMTWLRQINRHRRRPERLRFLGADVLQLREVQFTELEEYVADVAPHLKRRLATHLDPLRIGDQGPGYHVYWYAYQLDQAQQRELIQHARAVDRLAKHLPLRRSRIARAVAEMHAFTLRGYYEAYSVDGRAADIREQYAADILGRWHRLTGDRIVYGGAGARTAAAARVTVSMPDPARDRQDWVSQRRLVGGRLRRRYGAGYVSIATTFNHGTVLSGWQTGDVRPYEVPPPDSVFVDHELYALPDYLLDLHRPAPTPVTRWLTSRGRLRSYGGAFYDPADDSSYYVELDRWGQAFDGLLHLDQVKALQPLDT